MTRVSAYTDDALGELDAVGLVEELRRGRVSVPEVVEAALARLARVDPDLRALAHLDLDRARASARDPQGGFFSGVPTLVKDNVDVAGMPTRHGSDAWSAAPAQADGDLARMLLATGLLPLGKSRLSEFGFNASTEHSRLGAVRSPWSTEHTAGASSSGSAALVAAGAVPVAHGNDGGGSIRIPASVNGLVGLKPTRDRLPLDRRLREMPIRIVADGVLTRSVRDTAAFLREAEKVYRGLHLPPVGDLTRPSKRRLRVALTTAGIGREADPEVSRLTRETAALLEELGHTVVEARPPVDDSFVDDFVLYWALLAMATVRTGRVAFGRTFDRSRLDPLTLGLDAYARRRLHRVPGALRRLRRAGSGSDRFFERYDVTLSPTLAHPTPLLGRLDPSQDSGTVLDRLVDWVAFTPWHNVTGEPAISLPLAVTAAGLPHGMMFGAPCGHEARLVELAYELEEARPWPRCLPRLRTTR